MAPENESNQPADQTDGTGMAPPYAGFGRRHDIFYQYQGPEPESAPGTRQMPEVPPPPSPSDYPPVLADEMYYQEAESSGHKKLILGGVIALTLVVVGVLFVLLHQKPKQPAGAASAGTGQQATNANPDLVDTACYTFTLPKPHGKIMPSTECSGSYLVGNDKVAGVNVSSIVQPYASVNEMVSAWKSNNTSNNLTTENQATFGQYAAYQLFWSPKTSAAESDMTILVYTPPNGLNPKYTDQGAAITGFEIDGRYDNQSSSRSVYDSIIGSWSWK